MFLPFFFFIGKRKRQIPDAEGGMGRTPYWEIKKGSIKNGISIGEVLNPVDRIIVSLREDTCIRVKSFVFESICKSIVISLFYLFFH